MNEDKVKYWINISQYDLDTAKAMLETKRYLYVGFMCHQAVEKILKALYCHQHNEEAPYTHKLIFLINSTSLIDEIDEAKKKFISRLHPMNIDSRYPEYKTDIYKQMNSSNTTDLYKSTLEFVEWVKKKL